MSAALQPDAVDLTRTVDVEPHVISRRNTLLSAALAALCAGVVASPAPMPVRVVFGVPFVLVLPGYAVSSALFSRGRLERGNLLLLSIALSLSIVVIGALGLNLLPFGLTATTWAGLLAGVTVLAALSALLRMPRDADHESRPLDDQTLDDAITRLVISVSGQASGVSERSKDSRHLPRLSLPQVLLLIAALGITAAAIAFARTPLPAKGVRGYTVLWILQRPSGSRTIEVGVESSELRQTSYLLRLRMGDSEPLKRRLTLAPGSRWSMRFRVNATIRQVDARLFRSDSPKHVYRRVRLLIGTSSGAGGTPGLG
jgi:uncharacterized membrane protein